jgi:nucleotide-binding universal stress UspA family protein
MLRQGDPVDEIAKAVEETGADILVMGAYGQSAFRRFLLGSTTTQVARRVGVPILLYR